MLDINTRYLAIAFKQAKEHTRLEKNKEINIMFKKKDAIDKIKYKSMRLVDICFNKLLWNNFRIKDQISKKLNFTVKMITMTEFSLVNKVYNILKKNYNIETGIIVGLKMQFLKKIMEISCNLKSQTLKL